MKKLNKKSPRHLARSLAVQGLYQFKLNNSSTIEIEHYLSSSDHPIYPQANHQLLHELLEQGTRNFDKMLALYTPYVHNRHIDEINIIEQIILVIAAIELTNSLTIPAIVIINEAVELSKLYGAADSYKFVNGLVDSLAKTIRGSENFE